MKKSINYLTNSISEYYYDTDGRVTSVHNPKGVSARYEYIGDRVIKHLNDTAGHIFGLDTFILDGNGMATKLIQQGSPQILQYDMHKHLIRSTMYDIKGKTVGQSICVFENDDQSSNNFMDEHGKSINIMSYTYYTDKSNTLGMENMGMGFSGHSSFNPVRRSVARGSTVTDSICVNYYYHFDNQGRIIIKSSYNDKSKLTDSISYSYY